MRVISGTITKVDLPDWTDPKYGNQYQNITITGESGKTCTGRIGSKNGYSVGTAITVEVTAATNQKGPYNKFKRQQEGGYSGGQEAQGSHGNKDRLIVCQVVYKALSEKGESVNELELITDTDMIMRVGSNEEAQRTAAPAPVQTYVDSGNTPTFSEPPIEDDDDIPF